MQKIHSKIQPSAKAHVRRFHRLRRHPLGLPIAAFLGLLAVSGGLLYLLFATHHTATFRPDTSYIVIISHDHAVQTVPTNEPTVGALLHKLNIHIGVRDRVEPSLTTAIVQDNFRVNVYRAVPVTISDGTTTTTAYSAAATPRSMVTDAGIALYAEDFVTAAPAENLASEQSVGEHINIERSVPVNLNDYGTLLSLRTHATTVKDLLGSERIKLTAADTVTPALSTPITPGLQVFVSRKGTRIETVTQTIPAPIQAVLDTSLTFGTTAVRQQGSAGAQVLTYQVNTVNGVETSRTLLQTVVTVQPVAEVVARGQAVSIPADKQAVMRQAGIAESDYKYVDYIASHEGGWCPTKIQGTHACPGYMSPSDVPAHGGYGIFQATPGSKMASAGSDWATSAVTQIRWATGYANARYGSWAGAYNYWTVHHNW
ncbi:MAG TPA: ubiquitin-like domain-containing protein [Candidatus Saccharimonadales bacterium]|nr:ubiquitin-like domain-containing protein [Candidatus Saccharimonadales bacterium]